MIPRALRVQGRSTKYGRYVIHPFTVRRVSAAIDPQTGPLPDWDVEERRFPAVVCSQGMLFQHIVRQYLGKSTDIVVEY